jgi:high-affinity K+ transport system ATPase subunit B
MPAAGCQPALPASEAGARRARTLLLLGDAPATTAWVAARIGANDFIAGALPEQKIAAIRDLQAEGCVVAMIGDGVNDAPSRPKPTQAWHWARAPISPCKPRPLS